MDAVNRVGQVWTAQIGVERFAFVVIGQSDRSTWLVQNLSRVGVQEEFGTIKGTQFGIEEGIFEEFEKRDKGLQPGQLFHLSSTANILRERIT